MRTFAPLPFVVLAVACQTAAEPSASSVAREFYATTIAQRIVGAPTTSQLAALAPYLSDTLHALLASARQRTKLKPHASPT